MLALLAKGCRSRVSLPPSLYRNTTAAETGKERIPRDAVVRGVNMHR